MGKVKIMEKITFNDGQTKTNMILMHPGDLVLSVINAVKGAVSIYAKNTREPIATIIHYSSYLLINKN